MYSLHNNIYVSLPTSTAKFAFSDDLILLAWHRKGWHERNKKLFVNSMLQNLSNSCSSHSDLPSNCVCAQVVLYGLHPVKRWQFRHFPGKLYTS